MYVTDAREAKQIDEYSIRQMHIPSLILMEHAALCTVQLLTERITTEQPVLVVCGMGNNGGDGLAVARLLYQRGYSVQVVCVGDPNKASEQTGIQLGMIRSLKIPLHEAPPEQFRGVIVDALFGIGLSRKITGVFAEVIRWINEQQAFVCSLDIASGVCADTGKIHGTAVRAGLTVTFGSFKRGHLLYPGLEYSGDVIPVDIGFPQEAVQKTSPRAFTRSLEEVLAALPTRKSRSHKGTCGRVLVIAGSPHMSGACYFAAAAAYRSGCGLVSVLTAAQNSEMIRNRLPEALLQEIPVTSDWDAPTDDELQSLDLTIKDRIAWADVVVFGPGVGTSQVSGHILKHILQISDKMVVLDADGINLLAAEKGTLPGSNFILTPHVREMSRLCGISVSHISDGPVETLTQYLTGQEPPVVVLKDARTVVSDGTQFYINTIGNNGLATGGSGDVLSGVIAGLAAQGLAPFDAACAGVGIHGATSEEYDKTGSRYSMTASDILDTLTRVLP